MMNRDVSALSRLHARFAASMDAFRAESGAPLPCRLTQLHLPNSDDTAELCEAWLKMLETIGRRDWIDVLQDVNPHWLLPRDAEHDDLLGAFRHTVLGADAPRYARRILRRLRIGLPKRLVFPEEARRILEQRGIRVRIPTHRAALRLNEVANLRLIDPRALVPRYGADIVALAKAGRDRYALSRAALPGRRAVYEVSRYRTRLPMKTFGTVGPCAVADARRSEHEAGGKTEAAEVLDTLTALEDMTAAASFGIWLGQRNICISVMIIARA